MSRCAEGRNPWSRQVKGFSLAKRTSTFPAGFSCDGISASTTALGPRAFDTSEETPAVPCLPSVPLRLTRAGLGIPLPACCARLRSPPVALGVGRGALNLSEADGPLGDGPSLAEHSCPRKRGGSADRWLRGTLRGDWLQKPVLQLPAAGWFHCAPMTPDPVTSRGSSGRRPPATGVNGLRCSRWLPSRLASGMIQGTPRGVSNKAPFELQLLQPLA
jgi:hypothetical protein